MGMVKKALGRKPQFMGTALFFFYEGGPLKSKGSPLPHASLLNEPKVGSRCRVLRLEYPVLLYHLAFQ